MCAAQPAPQPHHGQKLGPRASGEFLGTICHIMLSKLPTHCPPTSIFDETQNEGDYSPGQLVYAEAGIHVLRAARGH